MGKFSRDKRDVYYRLAKELGYRSRSAFKLLQLHATFGLLNGVRRAVDLCAAPGGWTQVLARHVLTPNAPAGAASAQSGGASAAVTIENAKADEAKAATSTATGVVVAVDMQAMPPLPGVIVLKADITTQQTADDIIRALAVGSGIASDASAAVATSDRGRAPVTTADLVVCDAAPDVTGMHDADQHVQTQLVLCAATIATAVLTRRTSSSNSCSSGSEGGAGGVFVSKVFRGGRYGPALHRTMRALFEDVTVAKPKASRASSLEAFLVCRGFNPPAAYVADVRRPIRLIACDEPERPLTVTAVIVATPIAIATASVAVTNALIPAAATAADADADAKRGCSAPAPATVRALAPYSAPFVSCRSATHCFDSDQSYPLTLALVPTLSDAAVRTGGGVVSADGGGGGVYVYRSPIAPPIDTPYGQSIALRSQAPMARSLGPVLGALLVACALAVWPAAAQPPGKSVMPWFCLERCLANASQIEYDVKELVSHVELFPKAAFEMFNLGENGSLLRNNLTNVAPALHAAGVKTYAMISSWPYPAQFLTWMRQLFNDSAAGDFFIRQALDAVVANGLTGLNVDWEPQSGPDPTPQDAIDYANFLDKFAKALHGVGAELTVDVGDWSVLWDNARIAATAIDRVIVMSTYCADFGLFTQRLQTAITDIGIPKLGVGLSTLNLTSNQPFSSQEISERFALCESSGVTELDIWVMPVPNEDGPGTNWLPFIHEFIFGNGKR